MIFERFRQNFGLSIILAFAATMVSPVVRAQGSGEDECSPCDWCPPPAVGADDYWLEYMLSPGMPYDGDPKSSGGYPVHGVFGPGPVGGIGTPPGGVACICWGTEFELKTQEINGRIRYRWEKKPAEPGSAPPTGRPAISCCYKDHAGVPAPDQQDCSDCVFPPECAVPCYSLPFFDSDGDGKPYPFDDDLDEDGNLGPDGLSQPMTLKDVFENFPFTADSQIPDSWKKDVDGDGYPDPWVPGGDNELADVDGDGLPDPLDIDMNGDGIIDNKFGLFPLPGAVGATNWLEYAAGLVPHFQSNGANLNTGSWAPDLNAIYSDPAFVPPQGFGPATYDLGGDGQISMDDIIGHLGELFEEVSLILDDELAAWAAVSGSTDPPSTTAINNLVKEGADSILDQILPQLEAIASIDEIGQSLHNTFWHEVIGEENSGLYGGWLSAGLKWGVALNKWGTKELEEGFGNEAEGPLTEGENSEGKPYVDDSTGSVAVPQTPQDEAQKKMEDANALTGDPVDVATGAFVYGSTDLSFGGGVMPLTLQRTYSSRSTRNGIFGPGWSSPLLETYIIVGQGSGLLKPNDPQFRESLSVHWGDHSYSYLAPVASGDSEVVFATKAEAGRQLNARYWFYGGQSMNKLEKTDAPEYGYRVRQENGTVFYFCRPVPQYDSPGTNISWLVKVEGRHGNFIYVSRRGDGRPELLGDSWGRLIALDYDQDYGWITAATSSAGHSVHYGFSEAGLLQSVTSSGAVIFDGAAVTTGANQISYEYQHDSEDPNPAPGEELPYELATNMTAVLNSGVPVVLTDYYQSSFESEGSSYDRVKSQIIDGGWEEYRYESHVEVQDLPSTTVQYDWVTSKLTSDGVLEDWYHLESRPVERRVFTGSYDSWSSSSGSHLAGYGPGAEPTYFSTTWEYDSTGRLVSESRSTELLRGQGLDDRTAYLYDPEPHNVYSRNHVVRVTRSSNLGDDGVPKTQAWSTQFDPIFGKPVYVEGPGGTEQTQLYTHMPLTYAEVLDEGGLDALAWGILGPNIADLSSSVLADGLAAPQLDASSLFGVTSIAVADPLASPGLVAAQVGDGYEYVENADYGVVQQGVKAASYEYDSNGRPSRVDLQDGAVEEFVYDGPFAIERIRTAGPESRTTEMDYGPDGRLVRLTAPDGAELEYTYDSQGRVLEVAKKGTAVAGNGGGGQQSDPQVFSDDLVSRFYYDIYGHLVAGVEQVHESSLPAYSGWAGEFQSVGYDYFPSGRVAVQTDYDWRPSGDALSVETTTFEYTTSGLVAAQHYSSGVSTLMDYSPDGVLVRSRTFSSLDPESDVEFRTELGWLGDPWKSQHPTGEWIEYSRDSLARVIQATTSEGVESVYEYDDRSQVLRNYTRLTADATLLTDASYYYDDSGHVTRVEEMYSASLGGPSASTHTTHYGYDKAGNVAWSYSTPGADSPGYRVERDVWGRRTRFEEMSTADPSMAIVGAATNFEYDALDRLVAMERFPSAEALSQGTGSLLQTFEYDGHGRLDQVVKPGGLTHKYQYGATGSVESIFESTSLRRTTVKTSLKGRPLRVEEVDLSGTLADRSRVFTYDPYGRLTHLTEPNGSVRVFTYDDWGRLVSKVDAAGTEDAFAYDDIGRLVEKRRDGQLYEQFSYIGSRLSLQTALSTSGGGVAPISTAYQYHPVGWPTSITQTEGTRIVDLEMEYDSYGATVREKVLIDGVQHSEVKSERGVSSAVLGHEVAPGGFDLTYEIDGIGRMQSVSDSIGQLLAFTSHYGRSAGEWSATGVGTASRAFDDAGRLSRIEIQDELGSLLAGESYQWNARGELLQRDRLEHPRSEYFEFDAFSRLREWGLEVIPGVEAPLIKWGVDESDNIRRIDAAQNQFDGGFAVSPTNQMEWFSPHWLYFGYDPAGNETTRNGGTAGELTNEWDAMDRPTRSTFVGGGDIWSIDWVYDPLGRPLKKGVTLASTPSVVGDSVDYVWSGGDLVATKGLDEGERLYVRDSGLDSLVAYIDGLGGVSLVGSDFQGSVLFIADQTGLSSSFAYRPYGQVWNADLSGVLSSNPEDERLMFLGLPHDLGTGTARLGARTYDTTSGRFLSVDPLEEAGGFNDYSYAHANPTRFNDRTGLSPIPNEHSAPSVAGSSGTSSVPTQTVPPVAELKEIGPEDAGKIVASFAHVQEAFAFNIPGSWNSAEKLTFYFHSFSHLVEGAAEAGAQQNSIAEIDPDIRRRVFAAAWEFTRSTNVPRELGDKASMENLLRRAAVDPDLAMANSFLSWTLQFALGAPGFLAAEAAFYAAGDPDIAGYAKTAAEVAGYVAGGGAALYGGYRAAKALKAARAAARGRAGSAANGLRLQKQLGSAEQLGDLASGGGRAIAGAGHKTPIRDVERLVDQYGGKASDWTKVSSGVRVAADGTRFEIHAYRNAAGDLFEPKTKILQ